MLKEMFFKKEEKKILSDRIDTVEFNNSNDVNTSNYLLTYSNYYSECDPKLIDLIVNEIYSIKRKNNKNENLKYYLNYPNSMMISNTNKSQSRIIESSKKSSRKNTNDVQINNFFTFDPEEESEPSVFVKKNKKINSLTNKNSLYRISKDKCLNEIKNDNESRLINIESYNNMFNNTNNSNNQKNQNNKHNQFNQHFTQNEVTYDSKAEEKYNNLKENDLNSNNDSIDSKGYYDYIVETKKNNTKNTGIHSTNYSNFSFKYQNSNNNTNNYNRTNNSIVNTDYISTKNSYHIDILETNASNLTKSSNSKLKLKDRINFNLLRKENKISLTKSNTFNENKSVFAYKPKKKEDFKKEFLNRSKFN